ncbi:MAG: VTT domain-containing protein [Chloroflexi bacterium]|nr:VTT domain-containing protein [Chloroflexota bacterium]
MPGLNLRDVILAVGYVGLFAIVFAESGLLVGFFLPGDSLLFTAGFLASQGFFDIWTLMPLLVVGAIAGDQVGYAFGLRVGPRLFHREDSLFFHKRNLERAHAFYERHGGKAIVLARFLPVVRTFAPIVAGMGQMRYRRFVFFNVCGGALWTIGMLNAGRLFGSLLPADDVDRYLLPIIALIILVSVLPSALHVYRDNRSDIHSWLRKRLGIAQT